MGAPSENRAPNLSFAFVNIFFFVFGYFVAICSRDVTQAVQLLHYSRPIYTIQET